MEESNKIYQHEKRNLALVISGRFESLVGASALMVAMPLFVLDRTGSGTIMGLFSVLQILPRILSTPFGGVLGDRMNRKHIMVLVDELRGMILFLLWLIGVFGKIDIPLLLIFTAVLSLLDGIFDGPTGAMFGDVVRKEHMRRATSFNAMANSGATIIGPILGGMLYGFYGFQNVILMTSILYFLSGISEMFIIYKFTPKEGEVHVFKELGEGIKFVVANRGLKFLFTFAIAINFITSPLFGVVFPYIVRTVLQFSSTQYGLLQTFFTIGALLGNFLILIVLHKVSSKILMIGGLIVQELIGVVFSIMIMPVFGFSKSMLFIIFSTSSFLISLFNVLLNTPLNANLQILVPSELRSRVFSVLSVMAMGITPISSALYGYLIDRLNPFWFFFSINLLGLIVSLFFVILAPDEAYNPNPPLSDR
ncbi:MAG TPA: MFS transporter [Fervidobacterium sp.]|nr:MFS transporter [Fervidobacterium sp.]HON03290.1 MFS transporter [Fervidobacterium sp.]HOV52994.1 MFS transporter [Fervidobacterium sp.]HPC25238.1 MFS transporter [Fervidobacterium sp.]HQQ16964.1 MFS transporter [Fervidobacterium sp.]